MSSARRKWEEYCKLYFRGFRVDPFPTEDAALLRRIGDDSETLVINTRIITALSQQYNRGYEDGHDDALALDVDGGSTQKTETVSNEGGQDDDEEVFRPAPRPIPW